MISEHLAERLIESTHIPDTGKGAEQLDLLAVEAFRNIMAKRQLHAVFQPILDFRAQGYLGYEGLIRGPAGSSFQSPAVLFDYAKRLGLTVEFERLCREFVFRGFAAQRLAGRLFVNVSISCLADEFFINGDTIALLEELGMAPQNVVIELTENQQVSDFSALHDVLAAYRFAGYQIAVDDLGEGFSNLRMWSEIRPEFVKIDRHFISGIATDPMKFQLVRAMQELGETSHAALIAEGIETEAEFATVRDLGIAYGQGYLIARPQMQPSIRPSTETMTLLKNGQLIVFPQATSNMPTADAVMKYKVPVSPDTVNDDVFTRFELEPDINVVPVIGPEDQALGLINRHALINHFARPYRREVYGKRSCTLFMNPPLVVDEKVTIQEIGQMLGQSSRHHMLDGFIVTRDGKYIGVGSTQALMAMLTDLQIRAARYSNPLTQLPGNVPINEHIDRLLLRNVPFIACYCDLDNFKPYNDKFGYRKGDQVIQLLGHVLSEIAEPQRDFVGHIGGDDFVVLLQGEHWREGLYSAILAFDHGLARFMDAEVRNDDGQVIQKGYWGEDRRGNAVFFELPSLTIGCVEINPTDYASHHEVSTAISGAKSYAKKKPDGNSLFIERRRPKRPENIGLMQEVTDQGH